MRGTTVKGAYDLVLAAGTWAEPSRIDELWAGAKRIVACDGDFSDACGRDAHPTLWWATWTALSRMRWLRSPPRG